MVRVAGLLLSCQDHDCPSGLARCSLYGLGRALAESSES